MICRDKKWQHRRHRALIEVVGEVARGKQSYRFVISLFGLRRIGRYIGHGAHGPSICQKIFAAGNLKTPATLRFMARSRAARVAWEPPIWKSHRVRQTYGSETWAV